MNGFSDRNKGKGMWRSGKQAFVGRGNDFPKTIAGDATEAFDRVGDSFNVKID